jgi:1,4-dihydroxy-2-naphthoate polyprenyltransferase
MSSTRAAVIGPMRPNFLLLTPACVVLGLAVARWRGFAIDWGQFLLVVAGAVAAHIAVNALNEYADFRSGLDLKTTKTPFSGGTGTLPANPDKASYALVTGLVALLVTAAIGVYFVAVSGWLLLPLGVIGVLNIVAYTPAITRNWLLCLLAPGLGFGPLMVMGTEFCLTGGYSWTGFAASLTPFFLVSNLLLLNQFPDLAPDREVGRRHLIIRAGVGRGVTVYGLFLLGAYLAPVAGWLLGVLPAGALLGLLTAPLALQTFRAVRAEHEDLGRLLPSMGKNVVLNLATPVLMAVGLFVLATA